ncbi:MAG: CocE/NonD family hydrolase [Actinomycetota bacterium]|nr:CocE/NonD family hydrolase [Actinomycetota bacterium]
MINRRLALGALAGALALAAPAPAGALDTTVESFDGTGITTHFYPAADLGAGERAPTILVGHGWGGTGEGPDGSPAPYLAAGYNVVTWDARGFGTSGGTVMIDHPKFEAKDVSALIDFVAEQPEAAFEKAGDPLIGMAGPSYGGGIQFITAARDTRVDVIAPTIPWHNLLESLYPKASTKAGWDLALIGIGIPTSLALGILNPAGIETGNQAPQFYDAVVSGLSTGQISDAAQEWFQEHGPDFLLEKVKVPTLIAQGTVDTLFDLTQGHRNYVALERNGIPLKMMWFCGGHGICNVDADGGGGFIAGSAHVAERQLAWFDRYLKGKRRTRTGPPFEWIDQNGEWHGSPGGYPLRHVGRLRSESPGGTIPLVPGLNPTSGILIQANPDPAAPVTVPLEAEGGEEIVGAPTLRFKYSATGVSTTRTDGQTHIFGQIVDPERDVVVGNQATPIRIKVDGKEHAVRAQLTRIANVASAEGFELQLVAQSNLFDAQRFAGAVTISDLDVRLPITKPRR